LAFSIIQTLRKLAGKQGLLGTGIFPIGQGGGAQGIFYAQSWEFQRLWLTVYGNPTGYRCVEAIASNLSRPSWMIMPSDKPWPQHGHEERIDNHPLLKLLNQPNPSMSGTGMQRSIARDLELCGKAFWVKVPDAFGQAAIGALRRLPPQRVTVVGNQDDELLGFVYTDRSGQRSAILPENLVYLRYPHPERIYDGIAPALMAGLPAETDTASARFNRDLLHNDGAVPGYLILSGLTPDQFAQWKQDWESGSQPGKTRFLSGEQATYAKIGQSNQELTYAELRRSSQDDILRSFGVPRAVAFDVAQETYANAEQEKTIFLEQNILPKWVLIADELTQQLGNDLNVRVAFDLAGIDELQDSRDSMVSRAVQLLSYKVQTINELRSMMGWQPVPWGDEPVAPEQPMSPVPLQPGGENALPPTPQNTQPQGPPPSANGNGKAPQAALTAEGEVKALELAIFNPEEPRDPEGRWGLAGAFRALGEAMSGKDAVTGKDLAAKHPEAAKMRQTLSSWATTGENSQRAQRGILKYLKDPSGNPKTGPDQIAEALLGAKPGAPPLFRGMSWPEGGEEPYQRGQTKRGHEFLSQLKEGDHLDLPPASWSENEEEGRGFTPVFRGGTYAPQTSVLMRVEEGSAGLNIQGLVNKNFGFQKEWISGGRYQIGSVEKSDLSLDPELVASVAAMMPGNKRAARQAAIDWLKGRTQYVVTLKQVSNV
jgi:HK97 family phage portal protein